MLILTLHDTGRAIKGTAETCIPAEPELQRNVKSGQGFRLIVERAQLDRLTNHLVVGSPHARRAESTNSKLATESPN